MAESTVTMELKTYNALKGENQKWNLILQSILSSAYLEDYDTMTFEPKAIGEAIKFCFPEMYKKRFSYLRTQYSKGIIAKSKGGEE